MADVSTVGTAAAHAVVARAERRLAVQVERGEHQLRELESSLIGAHRDRASSPGDREGVRALAEAVRADLARSRRALGRVVDGTYGRCLSCGATIAPERLEAIPTADRCGRCA